jgi:hypothetical protein
MVFCCDLWPLRRYLEIFGSAIFANDVSFIRVYAASSIVVVNVLDA